MKPIPLTLGEVANFGIAKLLFYVNMSAPNTHYTLPPLLWKLFAFNPFWLHFKFEVEGLLRSLVPDE